MKEKIYKYIIVGAGLAGASAVEGIREIDRKGTILLIGDERHLPYNRPPLTKQMWTKKKTVEEILVHDRSWYDQNGITLATETAVTGIESDLKRIVDGSGNRYGYERLLLATGGIPRKLRIPAETSPGFITTVIWMIT